MNALETLLYEITRLFLNPVLVLLCLMFLYALFTLGMLLHDLLRRAVGRPAGQALVAHLRHQPDLSQDKLELLVLRKLELQRLVSRIAPMLGLVATMIPMGPALLAVSAGNAEGMAQHLVVAFAAVIVALLAAAITYGVQTVRRRWLLEELAQILEDRDASAPA
ncbi:MotA/TolQ/ExbB proton channel family protein [Hylemonella sp. W303a]|uniref:MotA/TolQ/ExbB proton channel family protein n=1 Tax=Hylemonella sp. W303a TaxID=3389873 RepID=UPI00396AF13D